jgi:hypothetical protein
VDSAAPNVAAVTVGLGGHGQMVAVIRDTTFDVVIEDTVMGPIGMDETAFERSQDQLANTAASHRENSDGDWWGYRLLINTQDVPGRRRAGSGAWAGPCDTHFWIDHVTGVAGSIRSQFLPFVTPESLESYRAFEAAVRTSL